MDKQLFKQLTQHLIRYNSKLERDVLNPQTTPKACEHCPKSVVNQVIICEPSKLGTDYQHFKHKCLACRMTVYDGSYVKEPRQLRPFSNYIPKSLVHIGTPAGPKITKNGKVMGRPRKDDLVRVRRDPNAPKGPRGRPRKNPLV